jgi:hypothetical protein
MDTETQREAISIVRALRQAAELRGHENGTGTAQTRRRPA